MELIARVVTSLGITSGVAKTTGNPWQKAEIVVEVGYDSQYPKKVALSNMKNAEEFARLPIGAIVKFHIDIESREYQGRYFTNVSAYKWELQEQQAPTQQPYAQPQAQYQQPQTQVGYPQPQQPYAPSPQSSGYQQPPQGYTQGYQQPFAQRPQDDEIPF